MREFSHAFELPIGRDKVFPLFTPKGEEAWVPGWKPNFLQPKSGETGRGMVFTTIEASGATAIWTCLDYIPLAGIARYFRVIADRRASIVEVTCTEVNSKRTIVRVSYQHVPSEHQHLHLPASQMGNQYYTQMSDGGANNLDA